MRGEILFIKRLQLCQSTNKLYQSCSMAYQVLQSDFRDHIVAC